MCSNHPPVNIWLRLPRFIDSSSLVVGEVSVRQFFSQSLQSYLQLVTTALPSQCFVFAFWFSSPFSYASQPICFPSEKVFCPVKLWTVTCCISQCLHCGSIRGSETKILEQIYSIQSVSWVVVTLLWTFVKSSLRSDFKVMMMLHDNSSVIRDEPRYGAAVTRFSTDYRLNLMLVWHKMCFHLFPLTFYV